MRHVAHAPRRRGAASVVPSSQPADPRLMGGETEPQARGGLLSQPEVAPGSRSTLARGCALPSPWAAARDMEAGPEKSTFGQGKPETVHKSQLYLMLFLLGNSRRESASEKKKKLNLGC